MLEIGQVEPNADKIIFIYSDAYYSSKPSETSSTEIIIAKDIKVKLDKIIIDEFINYCSDSTISDEINDISQNKESFICIIVADSKYDKIYATQFALF